MKKHFLNLGKPLNKAEQKSINGGFLGLCGDCEKPYYDCCTADHICGRIGTGGRCYAA